MKSKKIDYPAYLELEMKNGHVAAVNGKEFNKEGIDTVIDYVCKDENLSKNDVFEKIDSMSQSNGSVTLKLFNGAVTAI
jgi:hypothetical protein